MLYTEGVATASYCLIWSQHWTDSEFDRTYFLFLQVIITVWQRNLIDINNQSGSSFGFSRMKSDSFGWQLDEWTWDLRHLHGSWNTVVWKIKYGVLNVSTGTEAKQWNNTGQPSHI